MFVPCPHCGFLVALIVDADAVGQRCPRCDRALHEEGGDARPGAVTGPGPSVASSTGGSTLRTGSGSGPVPGRAPPPGGPARNTGRAAPSFARMRASAAAGARRWPWWLAIGALAVLLALQLMLSQRSQLAADAGWRPLVASVCSALRCRVPPWREPSAWTMLSRDVVPSPGTPGELEVTAAFRNQARWPQPLPVLVLSLTDRHGRTVAARAFTPDEYVPDGFMAGGATHPDQQQEMPDAPALLAAGEATRVHFRVREPGAEIVAFSFEFR